MTVIESLMNPLAAWLPMSPIEVAATVFGLLSVWFYAKEKVWCWPTGLAMVLLYIFIFFQVKLYADMGLQVVYVFLQVYGWKEWVRRRGERDETLTITRTSGRLWALLGLVAVALFLPISWILIEYTDTDVPYLDTTTTVTSLIAQWMISKKKLENWWVWILTDVICVPLYIYKGLYLTSGLYFVFLLLCIKGVLEWRKSLLESSRE